MRLHRQRGHVVAAIHSEAICPNEKRNKKKRRQVELNDFWKRPISIDQATVDDFRDRSSWPLERQYSSSREKEGEKSPKRERKSNINNK